MNASTMQAAWRRDQIFTLVAIVVSTALGWVYLIGAGDAGMSIEMPLHRSPLELFGLSALMWSVMMVAMMLPSASPMILTFSRVQRRQGDRERTSVAIFVAGYLIVWSIFSVLVALMQTWAHAAGLLTSLMGATDSVTGGLLLVAAGLYQWSAVKDACLTQCRTPLGFLMTEWRPGSRGALLMGLRHGALCVGCCWALMLLMFAGGVMNLAWMAALTVYVLAEKVVPQGPRFSRLAGAALVVFGGLMLAGVL